MDEPRTKWLADLYEILGIGEELLGGCDLRPTFAGLHAVLYQVSFRSFGNGSFRWAHWQGTGSFAGSDHRSADSCIVGDRHRRRGAAAFRSIARLRSVWRMVGLLFRRNPRHRRQAAHHPNEGDLSPQRSDP